MNPNSDRHSNDGDPCACGPAASGDHHGYFYWQLCAHEQARLRAENLLVVDEGYLAHDINWGRRLLDTNANPEEVPDVPTDWPGPHTPEHIPDAISAILQVAVELGLDPETICD